jgi:hypothetical protein
MDCIVQRNIGYLPVHYILLSVINSDCLSCSIEKQEWDPPSHQCAAVKHKCGITEVPVVMPFRPFFSKPGIGDKKKEYSGRKLVG